MNPPFPPSARGACGGGLSPVGGSPRRAGSRRGFSLVEIVITLGIMAFGLVPLMALMPIGLNVHRQAIEATVSAQIVARVAHDAQQADFSNLPPSLVYCFDDQGNMLTSGSDGSLFSTYSDQRRLYDVQVTVNKAASLPASGGSTGSVQSQNLARIQIDIAANRAGKVNLFTSGTGAGSSAAYSTYFAFVSKND